MSKYIPSKACPHRFCKHLHSVTAGAAVAVALVSWQLWLQIAATIVLLFAGYSTYLRRKYRLPRYVSPMERPNQYLIVRRWWAGLAVACDVAVGLVVLLVLLTTVAARVTGTRPADVSTGTMIVATLIGNGLILLAVAATIFCHWMATRPGKPKRVKVPRGVAFHGGAA